MANNKVLVIATHPDDETLGCGGTLLKLQSLGCDVSWLVVTNMNEGYEQSPKVINERQKEIEKVSQMYEFSDTIKLNLPTAELDQISIIDMIKMISNVFEQVQPDTIFVPNRSDIHSDHRKTFQAVMSCTKNFGFPYLRKVVMYETLSETEFAPALIEQGFVPNMFADVTPFLDKKIKIMRVYRGEMEKHPFPRSELNIRALATFRGATINVKYAEAFMILRESFL